MFIGRQYYSFIIDEKIKNSLEAWLIILYILSGRVWLETHNFPSL